MKHLTSIFAVLILAACGFQPTYGINKHTTIGVEDSLAQISISNIPNQEGQYLRNALIDQFYRTGRPDSPAYNLDVDPIRESLRDLDITRSSDTTRGQLILNTTITLKDKKDGKVLLTRNLRSVTSYNVLSNEFSTRVSEDNARTNALDDLARQIELQTALYFKR